MKDEKKSGMYGEMPTINFGRYTIADMSNEEGCNAIWIQDTESVEGGEFSKEAFIEFIDKFYNANI